MSEQQVLPPIDQEIRKYGCWAVEKRFGVNWNAFIYPIFKLDAEGRAGDIVAELACVLHDLGTREAQLSTTLASLAQSEAERERLQESYEQSTYSLGMKVIETATLRAELAREREANQGLRQVVKQYREEHEIHSGCDDEFGLCAICKQADASIEPSPNP